MKKTIAILIVLIVAAGAACFYWKRPQPLGDLKAAEYLPQDTIAFVELTDMQRSKARWQGTALHKIAQEPEVAAFLEKSMSLAPAFPDLERFRKLDPKEAFIAVTGQGAAGPQVIGGFDFSGKKKEVEELVADLKANLKTRFPDGKSDLQQFGSSQIETFAHGDEVVGTVFKGRWFFASNDLDLLRATLDRVDGKIDPKNSLRENDTYKFCLAKLPQDCDAVAFVNMKGITEELAALVESARTVDNSDMEELKKTRAFSAGLKIDGEMLHDALYTYKPGGQARPPLAFNSRVFTSPATASYFAVSPHLKHLPAIPGAALDQIGASTMFNGMQQSLGKAGLGFDDFKAAFGPEAASIVDWSQNSLLGSWLLAVDVRDRAKAQKFIETLTGDSWPKQDIDGTTYYSLPSMGGFGMIQVLPSLALTDKELLFGLDLDSLKNAVQKAKLENPRIDKSADFQAASALVGTPTDSFGYIDSRAMFERVYGVATRPLSMGLLTLALPHMTDYIDIGKLPPAGEVSKHLSPIVCSQTTDENGSLSESVGPVTLTQLYVAAGAGFGFVAFEQYLSNPTGVNALGPGMPGTTTGTASPP